MLTLDFQKLFGHCDDAIFAADLEGRVVWWGEGARRLLGHDTPAAVGRPCSAVLAGRDAAGCTVCAGDCHVLQLARRGEYCRNYDLEVRNARGRWIWVNVSTLLVPGNGNMVVVHMLRDVQERKRAELLTDRILADFDKLAKVRARRVSREAERRPGPACTPRERKVLLLLSQSRNTEQMASELGISPATVRNHIRNIMRKLKAHSRLEAVLYAVRSGLI